MEKMAEINLEVIPRELLEEAYKQIQRGIQQGKKKKRGA